MDAHVSAGHLWPDQTCGEANITSPEAHDKGRGADLQMDVKAVEGGLLQQERRRPQDMLEVAVLESRSSQLLYMDDDRATLMDQKTFEQLEVRPGCSSSSSLTR